MIKDYLREKDFYSTDFIIAELKWCTKDEFMKYNKIIKILYNHMNDNQRQFYKWYCYANIHTNLYQKNKIWDYLNDSIEYPECLDALKCDANNYGSKI